MIYQIPDWKATWSYKCRTPYPLLPPPSELELFKEKVKQKLWQKGIDAEIEHTIETGSVRIHFKPNINRISDLAGIAALITAIAGLIGAFSQLIASIKDKNPEFAVYTYDHRFSDNIPDEWWKWWEKQTGEKKPTFDSGFDFEKFMKDYWWIFLIFLLILLIK